MIFVLIFDEWEYPKKIQSCEHSSKLNTVDVVDTTKYSSFWLLSANNRLFKESYYILTLSKLRSYIINWCLQLFLYINVVDKGAIKPIQAIKYWLLTNFKFIKYTLQRFLQRDKTFNDIKTIICFITWMCCNVNRYIQ